MALVENEIIDRLRLRPIRFFERIGSTNDEALKWMAAGAAQGSVVITDEQVAGKGRLGRQWFTPRGSALILSVVLRPDPHLLPQMTMVGAVAICDMLEGLGLTEVGIKWPNDVLLNGRKVSGILPEAVWQNGSLTGVVLGIGVNVRIDFSGSELAARAISIEPVLGQSVHRLDLLDNLLHRLDFSIELAKGPALFEAWQRRLVTLGQEVRIHTAGRDVVGLAQAVDIDGALFVRQMDGQLERVVAGDIALG